MLAIHAGLIFVLLHLSGQIDLPAPQEVLQTFEITDAPPPVPPPPPPPPKQQERERPKDEEGGSPANIRSEATEVVAPKPKIELPPLPQIAVTETPSKGAAPTQGAANVRGPGTGAGGSGTGTGSGTGGGPGGGGGGGAAVRTRLVSPPLGGRDFPREFLRVWPKGVPLFARFRIAPNGAILECIVDRGTGVALIDANFCAIARSRLRFRPGLDREGRPVSDWAAYGQRPL